MINPTEKDEREYLDHIQEKLELAIMHVDDTVKLYSTELKQNKEYIYEHQSGMDEADMVAAGQSINRMASTGESAVLRKNKLQKLIDSPYFGRLDFTSESKTSPVYIGIGTFSDNSGTIYPIYDWRAPISSMFYDYELGPAEYTTPSGTIKGTIDLRRQYRIRKSRMEFMIENSVNIQDDILQKELSKSSDEKMKNIVATIQRDQNAVIRNETASVMIIQGVAGSGKTSIALHRIAFLLYRFRDSIKAKDILIISPNKVFADYISSVLPELGEDHIPETVMEDLAGELLEYKYPFQTFFQQVSLLLENPDEKFVERIRYKSSYDFLVNLNKHLLYIENKYFVAGDLRVGNFMVLADFIQQKFRKYTYVPLLKRVPLVVKDVLDYVRDNVKRKLTGHEKSQVHQSIPRMFRISQAHELYRDFYTWNGRKDLYRSGETLEYADVFPMIYYKIRLEGTEHLQSYNFVKHLLVDEMQDYTPVQYAVLSRVFRCKKTILGDVSQTVNPYSASSAEVIEKIFPQADIVKLFRSYRSSWEITAFAQGIFRNPDIIPMERHGFEPMLKGVETLTEQTTEIIRLMEAFKTSGHQSMGIICKTQRQAEALIKELKSYGAYMLTAENTAFRNGVIITTVHLSKGLEFDEVIVPGVSSNNYHTDVDRSLLYIACTRAMHELNVLWIGERSEIIKMN
ncbi:MAG: AAA family ATPase [Cyclobacteriaceae bacterium]|nr:AAA family ATPase [Cyclobacteriaceae bacterium]